MTISTCKAEPNVAPVSCSFHMQEFTGSVSCTEWKGGIHFIMELILSAGPFISGLTSLKSSFWRFMLVAVTRPWECVNKAIWRPRWLLSVQGSWTCLSVLNPQQADNDGDDFDHWPHLDSLTREHKQSVRRTITTNIVALYCLLWMTELHLQCHCLLFLLYTRRLACNMDSLLRHIKQLYKVIYIYNTLRSWTHFLYPVAAVALWLLNHSECYFVHDNINKWAHAGVVVLLN